MVRVSFGPAATLPSPACLVCCSVAIAFLLQLSVPFILALRARRRGFLGVFPHDGCRGRSLRAKARRARVVRRPRATLRPALGAPQLRAGSTLATGDGGGGVGRSAGPRP